MRHHFTIGYRVRPGYRAPTEEKPGGRQRS